MSGFEVAGLVLGIIPLFKEVFETAKTCKQRCEDFHLNTRKVTSIESGLKTVLFNLQILQRLFGEKVFNIPRDNAAIFEQDFNTLGRVLMEAKKQLSTISGPGAATRSRRILYRILHSNRIKSVCDEIISELERTSDKLRQLNCFLSTATVIETGVIHVSERQEEILDTLKSMQQTSLNSSTQEDTYVPSHFVPSNPPIAQECLDYTTVDDDGNPGTVEGKLKAELLQRIDACREHSNKVPIIAAVGMPGVGKTCALRGLGAEKDIRELFPDGVYYISMGKDSKEEDMKEALCSIVSKTGGRFVSQEMKNMSREKAIERVIEKAANWFKDRRCLFLLDDIWDGEGMGSRLLFNLCTLVQNCGKTSGLVYTTRDNRITPFEVIIRFNPLMSLNPVCRYILIKAAGFTPEEIEKFGCEEEPERNEHVDNILERCQGLKMALVVAGRNVRLLAETYGEHRSEVWESYASTLDNIPFKLLNEEYAEYQSLYLQFSIALQTLKKRKDLDFDMPYSIEEAFEALCVARKREWLPDTMLRRLWNLKSELQARELARQFARVSMVEITPDFVQGKFVEGVRAHDLVHDFAIRLSDLKQAEKRWIKGPEVWMLRLLESYLAFDREAITDASAFEQWWERMQKNDSYFSHGLEFIVMKLSTEFQTENQQSLLHLLRLPSANSHITSIMNVDENVERHRVCFASMILLPLEKPTITIVRAVLLRLCEERRAMVSEAASRVLVFGCLVYVQLDFVVSTHKRRTDLTIRKYLHDLQKETTGDPSPQSVFSVRYVHPNTWDYTRNAIQCNWGLYEECLRSPDTVECLHATCPNSTFPGMHFLGEPLCESGLADAGVDFTYFFRSVRLCETDLEEHLEQEVEFLAEPSKHIRIVCCESLSVNDAEDWSFSDSDVFIQQDAFDDDDPNACYLISTPPTEG